jgi:DNA mismatch endonuclease (patch repair protein)
MVRSTSCLIFADYISRRAIGHSLRSDCFRLSKTKCRDQSEDFSLSRKAFDGSRFLGDCFPMADKLSAKRRSWNMSRIRSRDTNPEFAVRRVLHQMGYRFRLHRSDLPGKPDVVLPKHRIAVFVHGCFWHQHPGCIDCSEPKTHATYWRPKLLANVQRDRRHRRRLRSLGWLPIVIWECQTKKNKHLHDRLRRALNSKIDTSTRS